MSPAGLGLHLRAQAGSDNGLELVRLACLVCVKKSIEPEPVEPFHDPP